VRTKIGVVFRTARTVTVVTAITVLMSSMMSAPASAKPKPVNPSNAQLAAAQARKQQAAADVGKIAGELAMLKGQLTLAASDADSAIATYNATNTALAQAATDVDTANKAVTTAKMTVTTARQQIASYLHDAYVYGSRPSLTAMFTSNDPEAALQAMAYQHYLTGAQQRKLAQAQTNTLALSNAEATRRGALARAQQLQREAEQEKTQALAKLASYRQQQHDLGRREAALTKMAIAANNTLLGLTNQRQAYQRWSAQERARLAAERARQEALRVQQQRQQQQQSSPLTTPQPQPSAAPPVNDQPWTLPLPAGSYFISTCFCMRWGEFHTGDDLAAPYGTPIYAIGAGSVVAAGPAQGFGNWVIINHGNGTYSVYGHMRILAVSPGQTVKVGQTIAYVGSEGFSTGPHLHLEIRLGGTFGTPVDPQVWLARRGVNL
jgi:murein DD-endopeptidase MepM/ murein hydrolase activator NlpD